MLAWQIASRMISGSLNDVAWAAPYWRLNLPRKLDKWSESIRSGYRNENAITALAFFGIFNFAAIVSDNPNKLAEILVANIGCAIGIGFVAIGKRPWVERALQIAAILLFLTAIAIATWLVAEHRLHEIPPIREALPYLAVFTPFVLLAFGIHSRWCRVYVFRHRRWPLFVGWGMIGIASVGGALALGVSSTTIGTIVVALVLAVVLLFVFLAVFAIAAALLWVGLLMASSSALRRLATAIRSND